MKKKPDNKPELNIGQKIIKYLVTPLVFLLSPVLSIQLSDYLRLTTEFVSIFSPIIHVIESLLGGVFALLASLLIFFLPPLTISFIVYLYLLQYARVNQPWKKAIALAIAQTVMASVILLQYLSGLAGLMI